MDTTLTTLADAAWLRTLGGLAALLAAVLIVHFVGRRWVVAIVHRIVERTNAAWDQELIAHRVPHRASLVIPVLVAQLGLPLVPGLPPLLAGLIERILSATLILVAALTGAALLSVAQALYARTPAAGTRPIKSYVQVAKLIIYAIAIIFMVARLADQSPWYFVSGLGAMMAIITLIFRDTLLSLVAGVQLTNNDLIRVGDWIEMPQFAADGDVVDIALNTVKVKNWDKTITVIPTHKFLDHSFKNWRGMFEGGGRRIKRAIHINMGTIRFLTEAEIERLSRFVLLREHFATKRAELAEFNRPYASEPDAIVNARRLTNIGTLRAYIIAYLRSHPKIHQEMTFLVRQLAPTPEGLPIELYVFTNDTRWAYYEGIQADIFDHILAIVPEFGLRVYQRPSGHDVASLAGNGAPHAESMARMTAFARGAMAAGADE